MARGIYERKNELKSVVRYVKQVEKLEIYRLIV